MTKQFSNLFFLLSTFLLFSCGELTNEKHISEGIIEYEIEYPESSEENLLIAFMPKEMILKFKQDKILFDFSGGMGMFKASIVSDLKTKSMLHMVRLFNNKIAVEYDQKEAKYLDELPELIITHSNETKDIAGYECKKAVITFANDPNTSFDIYYTEEINISSPNWSTPYKDIKGMLMQYKLKRYNLEMTFTAKKVEKASIDDLEFTKPDDYRMISKEEMEDLMNNFN